MIFWVALAAVTFLLAGGWRRGFWSAVVLSAAAQLVIVDLQPLPVVFSISFFALAIYLLFESRRRCDLRPLYWLPLLFWVWANLDAQFVLGLVLLATFILAETFERVMFSLGAWSFDLRRRIPLTYLFAVIALCVIATLMTPYSTHLLRSAVQFGYSNALVINFSSMAGMNFRRPQHYLYLVLFVAACLGLGRQHSRDVFKILLLSLWPFLAFRVQRDNWSLVLPAIAILADAMGSREEGPESKSTWKERILIAAIVAVLVVVSFFRLPTNQVLQVRLQRVRPAKACDYIRSNHLPGPIFNDYAWGGYLIWNLPEYPVSLDERINLYGDKTASAYFDVVMARRRMETLPTFARAQTILLPVNFAMTKALTTLPALQAQFREVYRDDIAVVLVRR
jgi:hypothetical protein